jgi:hypothetical protein
MAQFGPLCTRAALLWHCTGAVFDDNVLRCSQREHTHTSNATGQQSLPVSDVPGQDAARQLKAVDILDELRELAKDARNLPDGGSVSFELCGEQVSMRFAQRHLIDLGALLDGDPAESQ